mgnify:CR=1 FL=1
MIFMTVYEAVYGTEEPMNRSPWVMLDLKQLTGTIKMRKRKGMKAQDELRGKDFMKELMNQASGTR